MEKQTPQPQQEWVLTQSDWNRLKEHLVIGCTNQQRFLDSLCPAQPAAPALPIETCNICNLARGCEIHFGANGYPPCVERAVPAIRNATLDTMVEYHKEMITRLHTPKNGAVSIVSIRSAVIQHEKSITKIESLKSGDKK